MEFTIEASSLSEALRDITRSTSNKAVTDIHSGIKLEAASGSLTVAAVNAQYYVQKRISSVEIAEEGSIVLPGKLFTEVVKRMTGNLLLRTYQFRTEIISEDLKTHMNGIDPQEFPQLPQQEGETTFFLSNQTITDLIDGTAFAVSTNESKPVLTGVRWDVSERHIHSVATNSHRLAQLHKSVEGKKEVQATIPVMTLKELKKLMKQEEEIEVSVGPTSVRFSSEDFLLHSRIIEGNYPSVEKLFPKEVTTRFTINKNNLHKSVDRATLFASEWRHCNVNFETSTEGKLRVYANASELGETEEFLPIEKFEGDLIKIACDGRFFMEALQSMHSEDIQISMSGDKRPIIIRPTNGDKHVHLISPVRS
ncbi:DNA polymerase III subunit beta [Halobacillus andaensis]|uniref:Beta sliding clamp n=1 Tax=Halobacillus andaensis TaxID=1176239 RepID=A0A917AZX8_HALAA|nr:DNA polymerase III subunit beta [Halobacillus andaensis]MBP2003856.1 DNA polymerase-3 subunit beta [Halobacillus andaensis]GGF13780.1 DNA polymerase III subunit beta [Halobacillus andaensis]